MKLTAIAALAAGVGLWAAVLLAPKPSIPAPAFMPAHTAATSTSAIAGWFGGAALRVKVAVSGIMAKHDGSGAALLSIDGGPPTAYRVGQELAPGVILHRVNANTVIIEQDGGLENIAAAPAPDSPQGFVPVP